MSEDQVSDSNHEIPSQPRLSQIESKRNILGMVFVTISTFLLITAYALFQHISNNLKISLLQCIIIANITQHIIAWIFWYLPSWITQKPKHTELWYGEKEYRLNIWIRGFFYWLDLYFYWHGISLLPLGDAEAIYFLCPMFIAFGARIFLKEQFSNTFPIIFTLIIIGLIIICQPQWLTKLFHSGSTSAYLQRTDINIWGVIQLIIGCIAWSLMSLIVRISPKANWIQLEITSSLQAFAIWTPIIIVINQLIKFNLDNNGEWKMSFDDIMICAVVGVMTIFALIFLTLGYQYGEATKVSWMEYLNLPMGYFYQWIMFNQRPNIYETVGGSIMAFTCFVEMFEECYKYRKSQKEQKLGVDMLRPSLIDSSVNVQVK